MISRDTSRALVYAAEDQWSAALDRGGVVNFFGSVLVLPQQQRFEGLAAMQRYCDHVLVGQSVTRRYPAAGAVVVRARAGHTKAHYEPVARTIAIPCVDSFGEPSWACSEAVLLHELTHHLVMTAPPTNGAEEGVHGGTFTTAMCWLVGEVLGPESALVLCGAYQGAGVAVGAYVW